MAFDQTTVDDVRWRLWKLLREREFVTDKTGVKTVEIVGCCFDADDESVFGEVNNDWAMRELRWYKSCSLNVYDIEAPIPEIWKKVADADGNINSNYGWMIWSEANGRQYRRAVDELKKNPYSRRAVMIYNRPSMWVDYDAGGRSDFCCTNAVQYLVRGGKVDAVVQMRSNDLIFGYKGDRFWQERVLRDVAEELGLEPGKIAWMVGSAHVYERHFFLIDHWSRTGKKTITKQEYARTYPSSEWNT